MLALIFALTLLPQEPGTPKAWVDSPGAAAAAEAFVVHGTPELDPRVATDAAMAEARESLRTRLLDQAATLVAGQAPAWMPAFLTDKVAHNWVARQDLGKALQVIDRDHKVRDHGFGKSYQAYLLVREDTHWLERESGRLALDLRRSAKTFAGGCLAVVGGWALLALVLFWLDRASRGYMTGRLWLLGLVLGAAFPSFLLLN